MIEAVTVVNPASETLRIELRNPWASGLNAMSIGGLGPPDATVNVAQIPGTDGGRFVSSRVGVRNLTFSFAFMDSIDIARRRSYRMFPIKQQVSLVFEDGDRTAMITGVVEKNEVDRFNERTTSQVSILCPDPYFYSLPEVVVPYNYVVGEFEFPFANKGTEPVLKFGRVEFLQNRPVYYDGEVGTGVTIAVIFDGAVSELVIRNDRTGQTMIFNDSIVAAITGSGFGSGDTLVVTTYKGNKRATLIRGGQEYNLMNALGRFTEWIVLEPGDNVIGYSALGPENAKMFLSFFPLYEGL